MVKLLFMFWITPLWSFWMITEVSPQKTQHPEFIELTCPHHCDHSPQSLWVGTKHYKINCQLSTDPFAIWLITSTTSLSHIADKIPTGVTACSTTPTLSLPDKGATIKITDASESILDSTTYSTLKKGMSVHRSPGNLIGSIHPPTLGIPTGALATRHNTLAEPTIPKYWKRTTPLILHLLEPAKVLLISRSGKILHESESSNFHIFAAEIAIQIPLGFYWLRIIYTPKNQSVKPLLVEP
jgi:hypothetical protein